MDLDGQQQNNLPPVTNADNNNQQQGNIAPQQNLKEQAPQQQNSMNQSSIQVAATMAPTIWQQTNYQQQPQQQQQQSDQNSAQVRLPPATTTQSASNIPMPSAPPKIQPLLVPDNENATNNQVISSSQSTTISVPNQEPQSQQQSSPQRATVTKVKLTDELNIFDWFRTSDIMQQIADKAKNSVDSMLTTLDPGMKEYLYSGGNVNIIVISDYSSMVSPIRDAFQNVFGRATVALAKGTSPASPGEYPVKLACGFNEAIIVAQEKIKRLRLDTNNVPQNQVILTLQSAVVSVVDDENASSVKNGLKLEENLLPRWFFTYCMIIEDPVLGATLNCYSQLVPIDLDTVALAREARFPDGFPDESLGFARTIDDLMNTKLKLFPAGGDQPEDDDDSNKWLREWASLDQSRIIYDLSVSLANLYRRKWNDCIG